MPDTLITIDERLLATLDIEGPDGEVRHYRFSPALPDPDRWAMWLERLDTGDRHRVALTLAGSWHCSCRDATYRARKERRFCKHMHAARALHALAAALTARPQPDPRPGPLSETIL